MPPWSDILPPRPRRSLLVAWALLAALNLSAGLVIASWPERQTDLETIGRWGRQWLAGINVYATGEMPAPDYPPHAVVALSPLGILSHEWAVRVWTILNLGLALAAPYLAVRVVRPAAARFTIALPILMFLCWGGFRTLLQFSLAALVFGLLAMKLADRRPVWSGVCLGLALMKPQMAAPFLLWAIFTKRLRVATLGLFVVLAGFALFCLRVGAQPIDILEPYARILGTYYVTDENPMMVGLAQLRPLIALAIPGATLVNVVALAIAAGLLIGICILGFSEGTRRDAVMISAPPLVGVWSLLTFYHLTYGFVVLMTTATLLICSDDPGTRAFRRTVFWSMQLALMIDVPGTWNHFAHLLVSDKTAQAWPWPAHVDRVLAAALLGCLVVLAIRRRPAAIRPT